MHISILIVQIMEGHSLQLMTWHFMGKYLFPGAGLHVVSLLKHSNNKSGIINVPPRKQQQQQLYLKLPEGLYIKAAGRLFVKMKASGLPS